MDFYRYFGINKIRLSLGILFSTNGEYATKEYDSQHGFYSSSKECLGRLSNYLKSHNNIIVESENMDKLFLELRLENSFTIELSSVYGNEISNYLYQKGINLDNLIKNKYDDIWLFQLLAIEERTNLLKYNDNAILYLTKIIRSNYKFKKLIDNFIINNDSKQLIDFLANLSIDEKLIPDNREKEKYLIDVLYFIISNEDDL